MCIMQHAHRNSSLIVILVPIDMMTILVQLNDGLSIWCCSSSSPSIISTLKFVDELSSMPGLNLGIGFLSTFGLNICKGILSAFGLNMCKGILSAFGLNFCKGILSAFGLNFCQGFLSTFGLNFCKGFLSTLGLNFCMGFLSMFGLKGYTSMLLSGR